MSAAKIRQSAGEPTAAPDTRVQVHRPTSTDVATLLERHRIHLKSTAPGRYYTTCPHCSKDRKPHHQKLKCLGVSIEADGRVHFGCNHCGWTGPEKGSGGNGPDREARPQTAHRYGDELRKVRNPKGKPRYFWQHLNSQGQWKRGTGDIPTKDLLYRIDEAKEAIAAGEPIAAVEGEKDADTLWKIGIAATCNAHGASEPGKKPKWAKAHARQLAGADLVVFNDNDAPGYAHAEAACRLSHGIARRVRRLDLKVHWPEISEEGGDVSDWLAVDGHTTDKLKALIEAAPDYIPADTAKPEQTTNNGDAESVDAEIGRLSRLSMFEYERERKSAMEKLDVRASILDRLVAGKRSELGLDEDDGKQGEVVAYEEPEPWPEPVSGAAVLDQISTDARRFLVLPEHGAEIIALWAAHTYCMDATDDTPRLQICAPDLGCGKSTLLDFLKEIVYRPDQSSNITTAALFRTVAQFRPTLLIDEVDSFVGEDSDIRNVLNSGHNVRGRVKRTIGDDHQVRSFKTFAALAYAHIGELPRVYATLIDRSITITLARRLPEEKIESLSGPRRRDAFAELRRRLKRFANDHVGVLINAEPALPPGLINRIEDNWRPLLAIADAAGGPWPQRARAAISRGEREGSLRELLLSDVHDIYRQRGIHFISSTNLAAELAQFEGRPWAEYGKSGKPITTHKLARLLKPLGIKPRRDKAGDLQGYYREQFDGAFERYMSVKPNSPDQTSGSSGTPDETRTYDDFQSSGNGELPELWKTASNADAIGVSGDSGAFESGK